MTQLPVSILPGAPMTDAAGLAGDTAGTTTEGGGEATSVFASLLTALQNGETAAADAMSALGLALTEGEGEGDGEAATEQTVPDGEMPAGLAALVQSLVVPQVATAAPVEGQTDADLAVDATMTPSASAGIDVVEIETSMPATPAILAGVVAEPTAALDDNQAMAEVAGEGAVVDLTSDVEAPVLEVATDQVDATEIDETRSGDEQAEAALESVDVDLTEPAAADTTDTTDGEAGLPTDTGDPSTSPDDGPAQSRLQQAPVTDDGAEALTQPNAPTSTPTPWTAAAVTSTGPGTAGDQVRVASADAAGTGQIAAAEVDATAVTAGTNQTAAASNTERADAPVTIERITLREMPTVVVDRVRAIDPQGGMNRAVVRLDPPELGRIMLEIVSNGDEISVIARADNAEAARALLRQRTEIEAAMEALGLTVSDFDVQADDRERDDAEPEARRDGGFDDGRRPAGDARYVTADIPATEGELFL